MWELVMSKKVKRGHPHRKTHEEVLAEAHRRIIESSLIGCTSVSFRGCFFSNGEKGAFEAVWHRLEKEGFKVTMLEASHLLVCWYKGDGTLL